MDGVALDAKKDQAEIKRYELKMPKVQSHVKHFLLNRTIWKLKHAKCFNLMKKLVVAQPQKKRRNRKQIDCWNKKCEQKIVL